ncbi:MAG TPA: AI-2E family transporter [Candidatus Binatia bacterium]|jgi:predicted PurR-regulated permease PerM|nr:AI-2E family transporter [Candidatus Binatia bacterium]
MANIQWAALLEAFIPLLYVAAVTLLVFLLVQAKTVLVPVALAMLLAFILTPVVEALERRRVPRLVAVAAVVLVALGVIGGFGYVLSRQLNDLAAKLPHYSTSIREKISALRVSRGGTIANIQKTVDEVSRELDEQQQPQTEQALPGGKTVDVKKDVQPVLIVANESTSVQRLQAMLEPVFEPLATAGIVLVVVIFMLMQREDLRNRFIRLVGQARLTLTTKMLDEVERRISRFLLTQSVINAGFGTVVTAGLWWIGVPYAALWGVSAAFLRFVPYLGSSLALLLPTALAFLLFEGWWHAVATLSLFLMLDALTAYVIEPLLIGHNTGVSSLALLLMALFWTWLWGPIGLLLSTPLTVCLAVLGKHVPQLEFLAVLLGDEPALEAEVSFYQRLLAGDEGEAKEIVEQNLRRISPTQVFNEVLVPALILAAADRGRKEISEAEQNFVLRKIREIVQRLGGTPAGGEKVYRTEAEAPLPDIPHAYILGIPARSEGAQITLDMLCQLLEPLKVRRVSKATLASEVIALVYQQVPDLICITALPPGDVAHARYLCRRLRTQFPHLQILVVCPGLQEDPALEMQAVIRRLTEAGADKVAMSVTEARALIPQMLSPTLRQSVESRPATAPVLEQGEIVENLT